jgi:hypothetical protein
MILIEANHTILVEQIKVLIVDLDSNLTTYP